jgi:hypothetical protein
MSDRIKNFRLEFQSPEEREYYVRVIEVKRDVHGNIQESREKKNVSCQKMASINFIGLGAPGSTFCVLPQKEHIEKNPDIVLIHEERKDGSFVKRVGITIDSLVAYGLI